MNRLSGFLKKAFGILFAAAMILSLTACRAGVPAETSAAESTASVTAEEPTAQETAAEPIIDTEALAQTVTEAAQPKKLFETMQVSAGLVDLLEDTNAYHMIMKAENKTDKDISLEITAVAFNGITTDSSSGWDVPASGDAYLYMTFQKENLTAAGITGIPGLVKLGFAVYDEEFEKTDEGIAECVLDGANSQPVEVPEGETVYEENGLKIVSLGVDGDSPDDRKLKLCVENSTDDLLILNGGAAMAPGEELAPSIYACVLPGTKTVTSCSFCNKDYSVTVDPAAIPFADVIFRIGKNGNGDEDAFLTEPVKISLGTEQRYKLSEDGKTVELCQEFWKYDASEWTVISAYPEVLSVVSQNMEEDVPEEGRQILTAVFQTGIQGDSTISMKYHPAGISLEETDDYWPVVYCAREISFTVAEDGTAAPGPVFLEVPNLTGEGSNSFWYYIINSDGTVAEKNDAAG